MISDGNYSATVATSLES